MKTELLCKDCKHSFVPLINYFLYSESRNRMLCAKSFQDAKTVFDPVVGDIPVPARYESCGMSRIKSDICGAEGKKWEPKSKKQFFIAIKNSEKLENDRSHS